MLSVFFVITEGIVVLWSGVSMNVVRSVLMTVGQVCAVSMPDSTT